jgi:hypothetical protein
MVASAADLLGWIQTARAGGILGPEAAAKLYPPDRKEAVYAGGDDFGFQTGVMELDAGRDLVIINTNTGYSSLSLAAAVAEAMTGNSLPFEVPGRAMEAEGPGQAQGRQGGQVPDSPRGRMGMTFLQAIRDGSPEALRGLVEEHFSPAMRDAFSIEEHLEQLGQLGRLARASADIRLAPRGPFTLELHLIPLAGERTVVVVDLEDGPPHRITGVAVEGGGGG